MAIRDLFGVTVEKSISPTRSHCFALYANQSFFTYLALLIFGCLLPPCLMLLGYIMHTTTCSQCKVDSEIKHINKRATKYTLVFPCCFMRIYLSLLTFLASCFLHGLLITKYVSLSNFLFEGFP